MPLSKIQATAQQLDRLIQASGAAGYDPYDALNSPLLRLASFNNHWLRIALTQVLRRLPFNLRPWLGIQPTRNAKTLALLIQAYLLAPDGFFAHDRLPAVREYLTWLLDHAAEGFAGPAWGYSFPWQSRLLYLPAGAPSVVCTAFVIRALLTAYERLGDRSSLNLARNSCEFILQDCRRHAGNGNTYFSYTPFADVDVHNANLLGVSVLARVAARTGEMALIDAARPALAHTLADQNADGSWYYEGPSSRSRYWVDNFHTGFVLECLLDWRAATGDDLKEALERGFRFYLSRLFDQSGRPRRDIHRDLPVDIRDCAQALVLLVRDDTPVEAKHQLALVLDWALAHVKSPDGHFIYEWQPGHRNRVIYLRWQAWMLHALSQVAQWLNRGADESLD